MQLNDVEWLLDCTPRDVQIEATARSFYGMQFHTNDGLLLPEPIKINGGAHQGWGHFLEMRLGKTPLTLNELLLLYHHHGVRRGVLLSPNTYKPEWVREAKVFGVDLNFFEVESGKFPKWRDDLLDMDNFFLVVNYEALRSSNVFPWISEHVQGHKSVIVSDESIKLKNHSSLTTKQAASLKSNIYWRRILSGRPMTQGPQDLYSQLRFVGALDGQNFFSFRNRFCKMGGFKAKKVVGVKEDEIENLHALIQDNAFVAKRRDWGKVTIPDYVIDTVALHPEQVRRYTEMEQEFYTLFEDTDQEVSAEQVITKLMKQQQISSGFVYDAEGKVVRIVEPKDVPKMQRTLEILQETNTKTIVLYHYNETGNMLTEALADYNPAFIRAKGWMKKNDYDILEEKDRFNNDPKCRVIIASNEAVKYGNTLTGNADDRCTLEIFFENTYSLDTRSQVEMRNTASHQDWPNVYVDFASSPVERNVAKALAHKESLVEAVFGTYRALKNEEETPPASV